jgi:hypothetical protein
VEASLACGQSAAAETFLEQTLKHRRSLRATQKLLDLLTHHQRVLHMARQTGRGSFPAELFSAVDAWFVEGLLLLENDPVISSLAYHLLSEENAVEGLTLAVRRLQAPLVERAKAERHPLRRVLSLMLTRADNGTRRASLEQLGHLRPWHLGLLLVSAWSLREEPSASPIPLRHLVDSSFDQDLRRALSPDTANIQFGLSLIAARWLAHDASILEDGRRSAVARADEETVGMIRFLLEEPSGGIDWVGKGHYILTLFEQTLLRANALQWQEEINAELVEREF